MEWYDNSGSFEDYITYDDSCLSDEDELLSNSWFENAYDDSPDARRWRRLNWVGMVFGKYDDLYVECHAEYPRCWIFVGNGDDSIEYVNGYASAAIAEYLKKKIDTDSSLRDMFTLIKCMQQLEIAKED